MNDLAKSAEQGKRRKRRVLRPITVDTSRANTSQEAVRMAIKQLGSRWKEVPSRLLKYSCDVYWYHGGAPFCEHREDPPNKGKVNKFPGMRDILDKASLSCTLDRMMALFPNEYDFYPRSWTLPEQCESFVSEATAACKRKKSSKHKKCYIFKPADSSEGNGIHLLRTPEEIVSKLRVYTKPAIVQEYISDPALVENKKFDLRVYAVLSSIDPLKFYFCKEGMARFCTEEYQQPTFKNLHHVYMHLTNYSLNKTNDSYVHTDDVNTGSKRTMTSVFEDLRAEGHDVDALAADIEDIVCKTVIAITPQLKLHHHVEIGLTKSDLSCFQILGLDVLVASDMKPYLLECNAAPSLYVFHESAIMPGKVEVVPSPIDESIKLPLVIETLKLVCPRSTKRKSRAPMASQSKKDILNGAVSSLSLDDSFNDHPVSSDNDKESCLKKMCLSGEHQQLRIYERVSAVFIHLLGVRGGYTISASAFRKLTRVCKICSSKFTTADSDILFINTANKWSGVNSGSATTGLCFGAFVEAMRTIASRKYPSLQPLERLEALLAVCEKELNLPRSY
ncbi:tubulin polyglutamylase TTLL11-like [Ptychodera flava]|uniref:tubulin polyglutamylase TTLL11-like n=1 Tax=Ptychodera flava TaxID=63121 RepID=UPI00396A450C